MVPHTKPTLILPIFFGLMAMAVALFSHPEKLGAEPISFIYMIDRSAVPEINSSELTLIINVSDAAAVEVFDANGGAIPFQQGPAADEIIVTTASPSVRVNLDGVSELTAVGAFRKADLKDNFAWAYSHSFDDNFVLDEARQLFFDRNIAATFNIVSEWVYANEFWEGDFSPAEFNEIVAAGWDIHNHTTDHENSCADFLTREQRKADVLAAQTALDALIASSPRPDYKIIGFTIPCGGSVQFAHYPGIVHEIRDSGGTDLLFYEGGDSFPYYMNVSPPFNFDREVHRDGRIDGSNANVAGVQAIFDEMSSLSGQNGTPFWYTTLSHGEHLFGNNVVQMAAVLDYLIATYGSAGTNEAWIAPTGVVYSYLLMRDLSVVTRSAGPDPTTTAQPIPPNGLFYLPLVRRTETK